jgi:hypothetical protein
LGFELVLRFYILLSSSEGISLDILLPWAIHNCEEELGEYLSPLGLLASKLLRCHEVL